MKSFWVGFKKQAERVDLLNTLSRESEIAQKRLDDKERRRFSGTRAISPKQSSEDHGPDAYYGIEGK